MPHPYNCVLEFTTINSMLVVKGNLYVVNEQISYTETFFILDKYSTHFDFNILLVNEIILEIIHSDFGIILGLNCLKFYLNFTSK